MNYYPKGGRCGACAKAKDNCSHLDFSKMPVHRRDGCDVVVICTEFRQLNHDAGLRDRSQAWEKPEMHNQDRRRMPSRMDSRISD